MIDNLTLPTGGHILCQRRVLLTKLRQAAQCAAAARSTCRIEHAAVVWPAHASRLWQDSGSSFVTRRCMPRRFDRRSFATKGMSSIQAESQEPQGSSSSVLAILSRSSDFLPYAVVASALLALIQPAAFAWFTPSFYAPGLGFLMFAVGVNLQLKAFATVFKTPKLLLLGVVGQWVVKPLLGIILASTVVPALRLPSEVATGLVLVSCVSGAQLSNYATFLVHAEQAALSIVLTALSTAAGVVATPLLVLLLLGQRIPVDVRGMAASIVQIVILPVGLGLVCSTFLPDLVKRLRPLLAPLSLLDTCACVGASLSLNAAAARSSMGATVLLPDLIECLWRAASA
ncbi:hypothetical protein ABBQ38_002924 [Trebouxia sp. C0009 RCD-2024]